jgi:hypothetical protein
MHDISTISKMFIVYIIKIIEYQEKKTNHLSSSKRNNSIRNDTPSV